MSSLRLLFRNDTYYPVDPAKEQLCYLADHETVSASSQDGRRTCAGWATPSMSILERSILKSHPGCVWVTPLFQPLQIVERNRKE